MAIFAILEVCMCHQHIIPVAGVVAAQAAAFIMGCWFCMAVCAVGVAGVVLSGTFPGGGAVALAALAVWVIFG